VKVTTRYVRQAGAWVDQTWVPLDFLVTLDGMSRSSFPGPVDLPYDVAAALEARSLVTRPPAGSGGTASGAAGYVPAPGFARFWAALDTAPDPDPGDEDIAQVKIAASRDCPGDTSGTVIQDYVGRAYALGRAHGENLSWVRPWPETVEELTVEELADQAADLARTIPRSGADLGPDAATARGLVYRAHALGQSAVSGRETVPGNLAPGDMTGTELDAGDAEPPPWARVVDSSGAVWCHFLAARDCCWVNEGGQDTDTWSWAALTGTHGPVRLLTTGTPGQPGSATLATTVRCLVALSDQTLEEVFAEVTPAVRSRVARVLDPESVTDQSRVVPEVSYLLQFLPPGTGTWTDLWPVPVTDSALSFESPATIVATHARFGDKTRYRLVRVSYTVVAGEGT
jgi:hypothetical protein